MQEQIKISQILTAKKSSPSKSWKPTAFVYLLVLLHQGKYTFRELSEKTGLSAKTTNEYVRLLEYHHLVHIVDWVRDSPKHQWRAVYTYGYWRVNKSLSKPARITNAESCKKYRVKLLKESK